MSRFIVGALAGAVIAVLVLFGLTSDLPLSASLVRELKNAAGAAESLVVDSNIPWQSVDPASVGLATSTIDELRDRLVERKTSALLVVKSNRIVYEHRRRVNKLIPIAGVTKGVTASIALAVALNDGRIDLDDPGRKYIPSWETDPVRSRITIRHLVTHSSGIQNVPWGRGFELSGWQRQFADDNEGRFAMALNNAPVMFPPGTSYAYSSVAYYALSYALTASLRGAPQSDIRTILDARIMRPLGIPPEAWKISYGESYELDGMTLQTNTGGASYTARAVARIGQLMLNRGEWNGQHLVAPEWIDALVSYGGSPTDRVMSGIEPASGLGWQLNQDGFFPSLPRDAFLSCGANHEVLLVVPSLDIVVVRLGRSLADPPSYPEPKYWSELDEYLFEPLMKAVRP